MSQTSEQKLKAMFDEEVLQELRHQFDAADVDGNGQLDMEEACELFAKSLADSCSSEEDVKRTAKRLLHDMDADRSCSISFEEYCFRFGRKYQMEAARRRRQGLASSTSTSSTAPQMTAQNDEAEKLRIERERLEKERAALQQEREALERERSQSSTSRASGGPSAGGEARREEESRRPPEPAALVPGTRVQLGGLQGAASLNGKCGKVVRVDAASGRCVVDLDENAGQKSIRLENLSIVDDKQPLSAMLRSALNRAKHWLKVTSAQVQVWMAGYEWWQLLLGLAVVVLIVSAYLQNSAKHSMKPQPGHGIGASRGAEARSWAEERQASEFEDRHYRGSSSERHWERDGDSRSYHGSQDHGSYQSEFGNQRRHGRRGSFDAYDGDSASYHSGGYGGGGLLSNLDPTSTLLVLGGLGYLCWKGIIPVHRMSFFQLYMLWGIVEPLLFGGGRRRRSMYPMGFGMPRFL